MIKKETIKDFLKPSAFKIILALIIIVFPLMEGVVYDRSIVYTQEINLGLRIIHYISEILYIPLDPIRNVFIELGKEYFSSNFNLFLDYSLVAVIIFLPFLIFYCYFLSCFISFLINKTQEIIKKRVKQ